MLKNKHASHLFVELNLKVERRVSPFHFADTDRMQNECGAARQKKTCTFLFSTRLPRGRLLDQNHSFTHTEEGLPYNTDDIFLASIHDG